MSPLKKLLCQWKNHHIWYLNLDLNRICGGQSVQNNLFSVESFNKSRQLPSNNTQLAVASNVDEIFIVIL